MKKDSLAPSLEEEAKAWKRRVCFGVTILICEWCAIAFYIAIFAITGVLSDFDIYHDLTIYSQGYNDWTSRAWTDFQWSTDADGCQNGYEAVGNMW
jgi:hypothetical protein